MARTEKRFGEVTSLGTNYTQIGAAVPASTTWNMLLNVTNRTTASVNFRAYVADTSWSTGEPTGGTLKAAIAYDYVVAPGEVFQISGVVALTTEKIIVRASASSSLDILLSGVEIV